MTLHSIRPMIGLALLLALAAPHPAYAYIGPGAGLGAIAVTIAFALGFLLLIAGFVWYPIKRVLKNRKANAAQREQSAPE